MLYFINHISRVKSTYYTHYTYGLKSLRRGAPSPAVKHYGFLILIHIFDIRKKRNKKKTRYFSENII